MKRIAAIAALLPVAVWAETTPLTTHTELSYVQTGGNTDTKAFALKSQLDKQVEADKYVGKANAIYSKSDGEETANKYRLEGRWERTLNERSFAFLGADYTQDKFSGYDYPSTPWTCWAPASIPATRWKRPAIRRSTSPPRRRQTTGGKRRPMPLSASTPTTRPPWTIRKTTSSPRKRPWR